MGLSGGAIREGVPFRIEEIGTMRSGSLLRMCLGMLLSLGIPAWGQQDGIRVYEAELLGRIPMGSGPG